VKQNLIRLAGVVVLLGVLFAMLSRYDNAFSQSNIIDVLNRHGFLGILTVGAAILIIIGGIDLSMGSVVGLAAILFGVLMENGIHPWLAFAVTVACGPVIGSCHAVLVTQFKLQPFLVTLCGMFIYRGIARGLTAKNTGLVQVRREHESFGSSIDTMRHLFIGKDEAGALNFPMMLVVLLVIAAILGVILHFTAYGRYWYAIGSNEKAAAYAGVRVDRQKWIVSMICSTLAAFAGVLYLLDAGSAAPDSVGSSMELYAITAAVLGGCSLRGGEGLMLGFVLGALVQPVIKNLMVFQGTSSAAEPWVMGSILLVGTIADELIRRFSKSKSLTS
jgi:ribose transport system permease protein